MPLLSKVIASFLFPLNIARFLEIVFHPFCVYTSDSNVHVCLPFKFGRSLKMGPYLAYFFFLVSYVQ